MAEKILDEVFEKADRNLRVNTSYPLDPSWFAPYRIRCDLFDDVKALSYYIHIPFCKTLCRFCEYTRFVAGDEDIETHYLDMLERQCDSFVAGHQIELVRGLDVGGGTPTALSERNFRRVLALKDKLVKAAHPDARFNASVEFSFATMTDAKIAAIAETGFTRVSAGLQAVGKWMDDKYDRPNVDIRQIVEVRKMLRRAGIAKLNIDIMYGFPGQDVPSLNQTVRAVSETMPEQVTLYEVRYNMNGLDCRGVTREGNFALYRALYERLRDIGYRGRFGANAFSLDGGSAVSSYIASRMTDALPYKGFGVSAQSMTDRGISYNVLKGCIEKKMPVIGGVGEQDVYGLPGEELAAKYVSVALYGAQFSLSTLTRLLGVDARLHYAAVIDYLKGRRLLVVDSDGGCTLTETGVRFSGAIGSLFWPADRRRFLSAGEFS